MKKQEYLEKIDSLGFDKDKYCIISGGVMLMLGLREETSDIDLKVKPDYFQELQKKYNFKKSNKFSYLYELSNEIELAVQDFSEDEVDYIEGYPINKVENELEWKIAHNREKDKNDIENIKVYLKRKGSKK